MEKYSLPELPFDYKDLEPYITEETLHYHHGKHHQAYVNNLNAAVDKHPELFEKSVEELLANLDAVPEDILQAVKNNGGGVVNHTLYWNSMVKGGGEPSGELAEAINKTFGGFEDFKQKFEEEGLKRFGSGWVWLVKNGSGELEILSTANQDTPLSDGKTPILLNDVWEHAYYLQYKNLRADYLKAWWNIVNWQMAEKRFNME
jgi:Fe-Mn family superoxide dismutase